MIVTTIITRSAFLLQSIATTSYLYTNANNAPQSSTFSQLDLDQQMKVSSSLVRQATSSYLREDPTLAGKLLRLAFHDAATREQQESRDEFSGGPNASIRYEVSWSENRAISRPLKVVECIYNDVGKYMGLSFADCIALSGAQSVTYAGGPPIPIKLGRIDASVADVQKRRAVLKSQTDRSIVDTTLPSAGLDSDGLRLYFGSLGLSEAEFVAFCGAHDLGRHVTLLDMEKPCLRNLTRECLENAPVLMPFVSDEPDRLSNTYFKMLLKWYDRKVELGEVAFIPTDVDLVVDEGLRKYVEEYAKDQNLFYSNFAVAYQKLVDAGASSEKTY